MNVPIVLVNGALPLHLRVVMSAPMELYSALSSAGRVGEDESGSSGSTRSLAKMRPSLTDA